MRRIIVFCPNLVGDTVMATPTLKALRHLYPDAQLDVLIKAQIAATLDAAPWIDNRLLYSRDPQHPHQSFLGVVRQMRRRRYDLAVLLPNSFRSALMARMAGASRRIGYARGGRGWLLTDSLQPPLGPSGDFQIIPAVDYYSAIAKKLGALTVPPRLELHTTSADEAAADYAFASLGLDPNLPVVCLNTGGAFGPAKNWPVPSFARLAGMIAGQAGLQVLVLCGPSERAHAHQIAAEARSPRVVSLAQQPLSIGLSKACVKRAASLVTTDSGPRHFAAAFGVPVVGLFGPTHIAWTRTFHPHSVHLQIPVPCGPCQKPVCPEGHHRCMVDLSPEVVFETLMKMLGGQVNRQPSQPRASSHEPMAGDRRERIPGPPHPHHPPDPARDNLARARP